MEEPNLFGFMQQPFTRVPKPPGKSWFFSLKFLENHFGPGKSWKLKFNVLEKYP